MSSSGYLTIWQEQLCLRLLFWAILENLDLLWQAKENHRKSVDQIKRTLQGVCAEKQKKPLSSGSDL